MKTSNRIILSTSPLSQPAGKPRGTASLTHPQRPLYRRKRRYPTGKERDSETGLYYFGARYLDGRTGRWISGDPAVGEYVPEAPVNDEARKRNGNLPGQGGVFNYVNLHVYHYAGNNPVRYFDPNGREAWESTTTWNATMEDKFRENFSKNAIKITENAIKNNETIDCADVALTALIDTAQEMGLRLTFDYYDSSKRRYKTVSSSDSIFKNKKEFLSFVKLNMGAITLLDHKTTRETTTIKLGDLIMFDLRADKNPDYDGHTVIIVGNPVNNRVNTVQGHLSGTPEQILYTLGTYMYGAKPEKRSFRYDRLFR